MVGRFACAVNDVSTSEYVDVVDFVSLRREMIDNGGRKLFEPFLLFANACANSFTAFQISGSHAINIVSTFSNLGQSALPWVRAVCVGGVIHISKSNPVEMPPTVLLKVELLIGASLIVEIPLTVPV